MRVGSMSTGSIVTFFLYGIDKWKAIAALFDCSTDNVSLHLKNIFESGEICTPRYRRAPKSRKRSFPWNLGLIDFAYPGSPNKPEQAYRLTAKGLDLYAQLIGETA